MAPNDMKAITEDRMKANLMRNVDLWLESGIERLAREGNARMQAKAVAALAALERTRQAKVRLRAAEVEADAARKAWGAHAASFTALLQREARR